MSQASQAWSPPRGPQSAIGCSRVSSLRSAWPYSPSGQALVRPERHCNPLQSSLQLTLSRRTHAEGPAASSGPRPARRRGPRRRPPDPRRRPRTCRCCACTVTSTSALFATDAPFGDPAELLVVPGPLRHPDADLPGHLPRPARAAAPRRHDDRRAPRDLAGVLRELAPLPRDAEPVLAGARVRRGPRRRPCTRRPRPRTSCTTRSPRGSPSRSSGRGRCSTGSASS